MCNHSPKLAFVCLLLYLDVTMSFQVLSPYLLINLLSCNKDYIIHKNKYAETVQQAYLASK